MDLCMPACVHAWRSRMLPSMHVLTCAPLHPAIRRCGALCLPALCAGGTGRSAGGAERGGQELREGDWSERPAARPGCPGPGLPGAPPVRGSCAGRLGRAVRFPAAPG